MTGLILNSVLLGGYYAILAVGLAFMYSVMKIINLAHGALIIFAAYGLHLLGAMDVPLYLSIALVGALMFGLGMGLHAAILSRASSGGALLPLLATFGLSILIDNLLFQVFGADNRSLAPLVGDLSWASFELPGNVFVGQLSLYILLAAIVIIAALEAVMRFTTLGRRIQATSQDRATASLLGINTARTAAIATGIALTTGVFAAAALGLRSAWAPYSGAAQLLFAFEVVVIGGVGSLWRVLVGAMVLAIAQSIGAAIHPQGFLIGGHLAFLMAVFFRLPTWRAAFAPIARKGVSA